jgi:hypothetical protein
MPKAKQINKQDMMKSILSKPNNTLNKTSLKNMKRETLEVLLKTLENAVVNIKPVEPNIPVEEANIHAESPIPKSRFTKKERKLIEFSDDEKDDEIQVEVTPQTVQVQTVQPEVTHQPVQVTTQPLQVTPQPVQVTPQPVQVTPKKKPVLTGRKKEIKPEPVKIKKPTLDDLKEEIKELIAEFANLIIDDIKAYKDGEITDDELIDSHNNLRHETEDHINIMCSTVKRTDVFDYWVDRLLNIIRNKVERVL